MNTNWAGQYEDAIEFIQQLCGIALDESKEYLINSRFEKLTKQFNAASLSDLVDKAKAIKGEPIRRAIIEAITIRETSFFRDPTIFDALRFRLLPEIIRQRKEAGSNKIRIWSAAASSGQEACSIAMTLLEAIPDINKWDIEILGTDISADAIAKAKRGIYSKLEVERGMPSWFLRTYMRPQGDSYKVTESVAKLIQYREMNLLQAFPFKEPFDVIFCRNVAIYFEKSVKTKLFRRMLPSLQSYGYVFVGVSESLVDCGPEFKPQTYNKATFYQPNLGASLKSPLLGSETYSNSSNGRIEKRDDPKAQIQNRVTLTSDVNTGVVRYEPTSCTKPRK